jgi:uncharacterized protein (DUF1330 family)
MSAFMIVNVKVKDADAFEEYKAKVPALIQKHGGEYVALGGKVIVFEGAWDPSRLVVIRFPTLANVQNLFDDPEYHPLILLRQRGADSEIVAVEGI